MAKRLAERDLLQRTLRLPKNGRQKCECAGPTFVEAVVTPRNGAGVLRLVLGDQLSDSLAGLTDLDATRDVVLMAEVRDEATYVRHHKQKIALTFAAMRAHANRLTARGVTVRYVRIDAPDNTHSIIGELHRALADDAYARVVITEPGEIRLAEVFAAFAATAGLPVDIREDRRFICSHARFRRWAADRRELRMEYFYREMRRETGLLWTAPIPKAVAGT